MKMAARKIREWTLLGAGTVLALALIGGGEPVRGAIVAVLGAVGAALVSFAGRIPRRWPRLQKAIGRLLAVDERLEPALDAAEDALVALAGEGARFDKSLREGVHDLSRRAVGLSRIRAGHEATLAHIFLETHATQLELQARAEHARVSAELEQIRGVLATIGPSVRHLSLLTRAEQLDIGQAPAELAERMATLRAALHEELTHA